MSSPTSSRVCPRLCPNKCFRTHIFAMLLILRVPMGVDCFVLQRPFAAAVKRATDRKGGTENKRRSKKGHRAKQGKRAGTINNVLFFCN